MIGRFLFRFFLWPGQPFGFHEKPNRNSYCEEANKYRDYGQGFNHKRWGVAVACFPKNLHLFPIRNAGGLRKTTISAIFIQ